jgi:hypothetical protein
MLKCPKVLVVPILLMALGACGSGAAKTPGVATAGGAPTASAGTGTGDQADGRKFKECLQKNGVDVAAFEKGESADGVSGLSEAVQECREFLPDGGELPKLSPAELLKTQQYAKCMRSNGVPDFPDPNADGNFGADWDGTKILGTETGEKANATCGRELVGGEN